MTLDVLIPDGGSGDPLDRFAGGPRPPGPGRPRVLANMVMSVDGATAVAGESRGLSGPMDRRVFHHLRGLADVILAGAATVRADRYGPARPDDATRVARRDRGQAPVPAIGVVTGTADLDTDGPLFTEAEVHTLVITPEDADPDRVARVAAAGVHIPAGRSGTVDLAVALARLAERGAGVVLCEGGPGLLGQFAAAGLVDELFVTISPRLVSGDSARVLRGPELHPPTELRLAALGRADDMLFARYVRSEE